MPAFTTEDDRWEAVAARDPAADGSFVYAVTTTGICCRPACPSRRPRRRNVRFFDDCAAAVRAGFRPCRRCRPDQALPHAAQLAAIERACTMMAGADAPPSLAELAAAAGLSRWHFHRLFRDITGVTPRQYAAALRERCVRRELSLHRPVTEAVYTAGYRSSGRFYSEAREILGMRPGAFRDGGRGVTIRFAVGECVLGAILVAATSHGICSIALGDDPESLLVELQDQFPAAELVGGDAGFEQWVARVVACVDQPELGLDLPLHVAGTAFQHRVWRKLREIPPGETRTYSQLAAELGKPETTRAVAGACAANRLAVAIPCHRVVRRDGAITGYRWGIDRKARLLARERNQDPA